MAYELKAIFEVQDRATAKIRRITQEINKLDIAMKRATSTALNLSNALNRAGSNVSRANNSYRTYNNTVNNTSNVVNRNTNIINRNTNAIHNNITQINNYNSASNRMRSSINRQSSALSALRNTLTGIAGAYITAHMAAAAFNATIGAAARYEQSEVAVHAIFNDKEASDAYLAMVDKMAIDSPLLNSGEMLASSKGLVAMTKNVEDLADAWSIIERLMVLDPTQGTDGAAFALKEMWQGDSLSMVERFGLNKKELNRIKKLDIPSQIAEINKLLDGMGITQSTVDKMGQTTLGYWAQIQERVDKFMRTIGGDGNNKLGQALAGIVEYLDTVDTDAVAKEIGDSLGTVLESAIEVGKVLWRWKEPLAYVVGALSTALATFMLIGTLALVANPVALWAAGFAAAAVGMLALYNNSETVKGAVDGIIGKVKELWSAFKEGGAGGVLDSLFGEGTAEKVASIVDTIKTKFAELQSGFEIVKGALAQGWATLSSIFTNAWAIISPILSGLGTMLSAAGEYAAIVFNNIIAPALSFVAQLFSTLWAIAQPILILLGALFQLFGAIVKAQWETILKPFAEFIMGGLKNAFDAFSDALSVVAGWFNTLSSWAMTAKGHIQDFANYIASIKLPSWLTNGIGGAVNFVGGLIGAGGDDSGSNHYHGLDNVPYDGYNARLHKGERIMTAQENKEYTAAKDGGGFGGGVTITGNTFNIREDADIGKVAVALADLLERRSARG